MTRRRPKGGASTGQGEYTKIGVDRNAFSVSFYESETGSKPVEEFLRKLAASDPDDHRSVVAGLAKLKDRRYHREPLSKSLRDGLFELRHVGKLNTRIIYFFQVGQRIIAVHAIRNKGRKVASTDLETAHKRMIDWMERFAE